MQDGDDSGLNRFVGTGAAVIFASYLVSPILPRLSLETTVNAAYLGALALLWLWRPFALGKLAGWVSLAVGAIYAAITGLFIYVDVQRIADADAANANRCLAIQRDMLSAHPRRPDGPDLFQALGCRPQGEGSVYATSPR